MMSNTRRSSAMATIGAAASSAGSTEVCIRYHACMYLAHVHALAAVESLLRCGQRSDRFGTTGALKNVLRGAARLLVPRDWHRTIDAGRLRWTETRRCKDL